MIISVIIMYYSFIFHYKNKNNNNNTINLCVFFNKAIQTQVIILGSDKLYKCEGIKRTIHFTFLLLCNNNAFHYQNGISMSKTQTNLYLNTYSKSYQSNDH